MKYFFKLLLLLVVNVCFSQNRDTIKVELDLKKRIEFAQKDLTERYYYTKSVENTEDNHRYRDSMGCKFITDYKLEELKIKTIPQFELTKDFKFQGNVLEFINFNPSKRTTIYSINDKDGNFIYFEFDRESRNDDFNSAFMFDCIITTPMGSNILGMMKLRLHEKYFAFRLAGLSQVLFIVENGLVYAISKPKLDGTYEKTEINKFFAKNVGYGGIEHMMDSDEEQYTKNYTFSPAKKRHKKPYFFSIKLKND